MEFTVHNLILGYWIKAQYRIATMEQGKIQLDGIGIRLGFAPYREYYL